MTFCIAMQNRRAVATYWRPNTIISQLSEYLIVSRSRGKNTFLSISNAGACTGLENEAPQGLSPDLVMCATLISQGPNGQEIFVVEKTAPDGFEYKGSFVGADGYFSLECSDGNVTLTGATRFKSGSRKDSNFANCILLGENEPGATVHFKASYVPWQGELLPAEFGENPSEFNGSST